MANKTVDNLNIQISADAQKAEKALDSFGERLKNIKNALNIDSSSLSEIGNIFNFNRDSLNKATVSIRKTKKQISELSKISLTGIINDLTELSKVDLSNFEVLSGIDFKGLKNYQKEIKNVTSETKNLDDAFKGIKSNLNLNGLNATELERGLRKAQNELKKLYDREQYLKTFGKDIGDPWDKLQYKIVLLTADVEKYEEALDRIRAKSNEIKITQSKTDDIDKNIDNKEVKYIPDQSFNYNKSAMEKVFPGYSDVQNFAELMNKLGVNAAQAGIQINQSMDSANVAVKKVITQMDKVVNKSPQINKWEQLGTTIQSLAKILKDAWKAVQKLFNNINNTIKNTIKLIGSVSANFDKIIKKIFGTNKKKKSNFGLLQMLGSSILYSSVFQAIGAIQDAIKTGSDNLAIYSSQYNASISNMTSSLLTLKNAWSAAFAPIIDVVAPILSSFVDMMSRALNTVGQFFAALTGKTFTVQAKKVYQDYASGLSSVGSSSGDAASGLDDATGSAEELKKALSVLPFDELNQLVDNTAAAGSGSAGGSGGGAGGIGAIDPSQMFVDVPVAGYIQDFVEKLKKSWEKSDFYWLGEMLGEKINDALKNIPWSRIKKTAKKLGESLATFLNGGIETIDGKLLGRTIAEVINTAVTFSANFFDNFHFESLGELIADAINGAIQEIDLKEFDRALKSLSKGLAKSINSFFKRIDWDKDVKIISEGLNIVIESINDFLVGVNWVKIGEDLSEGVRSAFKTINWSELGDMLGNGFMVAWDILSGFVEDMSQKDGAGITGWQELGTSIGTTLNGVFKKINFSEISDTLTGGINGAFQTLLSFTETFSWQEFADNVTNGINEFIEKTNWEENGKSLETFLDNFLGTLLNIAERTNWEEFGESVGKFLSEIDWGQHLMQLFNILYETLGGIWNGLGKTSAGKFVQTIVLFKIGTKLMPFVNNISKFFTGSTVTQKLSNAFQNLFSKSMKNGVGYAVGFAKALGGNNNALQNLQKKTPKVSKAVSTLSDAFKAFKTSATNGNWMKGIGSALDTIRNSMTKTQKVTVTAVSAFGEFSILKDTFKDLITGSGNLAVNIAELATTTAASAASMVASLGPKGLLVTAVTGLISLVSAIGDAFGQSLEEVVNNSAIGQFANDIDQVSQELSETAQSIQDSIQDSFEVIGSAGYADKQVAQELAREYEGLRSQTQLTADEQDRLRQVSQELADLIPGLNGYIDEQTGYLDVQNGVLETLIENQELYAKKQAAQELLTEAYKQQYDATYALQKAQNDYNAALDEFIQNNSGLSDTVKNLVKAGDINGLKKLNETLEDGDATLKEFGVSTGVAANKMIEKLEESLNGYQGAIDEAKDAQEEANTQMENTKTTLQEVNSEIAQNEKQLIAAQKSTNEFQQALKDINTTFNGLNLEFGVSNNFAESLALNADGATESIVGYFDKLKSQTQLSSDELSELFANIAPNMTIGFTDTLANEEPNIQAQIATIIGNIGAGAQVSAQELEYLFSTIGYNIPNSIITQIESQDGFAQATAIDFINKLSEGFALSKGSILELLDVMGIDIGNMLPQSLIRNMEGQEANVQLSTISLLAQMQSGAALTEDQLVYTFQSLGVGIINDGIIASLSNAEPDVQEKAIALLGKIQSASESQRGPLIEEFNNLGVGTINEGLLSALDNMSPDTRKKAIELLSQLSGATADEKENIYKQLKEIGIDAGTGLLDGVGEKERDLKNIGIKQANIVIDSTAGKEGFDEGSPSKKMRKKGEYAVQGLVNGLRSKLPELKTVSLDMTRTVLKQFENFAASLYTIGQNAAQYFSNGFQSIYIPTPHLNIAGWNNQSIGNGESMSIPQFSVNWYKAGGLFTRATIAGIGEAGNEAVLPLENRRTMSMIANSILDSASPNMGLSKNEMRQAVAEGVAMAMMNNSQNQQPINVYAELKTENDEVLARAVTRGQKKIEYRMNPVKRL